MLFFGFIHLFILSNFFSFFVCVLLANNNKKTHSYQEEGTGIQTSWILAFPAPAPLSLLGLLNIKHYCIISPYFYRFRIPISCRFPWGVLPYLRTYKPSPLPTNGNGLGHYMKSYMQYILLKFAFIICNDKLVFVSE